MARGVARASSARPYGRLIGDGRPATPVAAVPCLPDRDAPLSVAVVCSQRTAGARRGVTRRVSPPGSAPVGPSSRAGRGGSPPRAR